MLYHSDKGRQCYTCYLTTDSGPLFPIDEREKKHHHQQQQTNIHMNGTERNKMKWNSVAEIINENSMKHALHIQ